MSYVYSSKKLYKKSDKNLQIEADKMMIVTYLNPCVKGLKLEISDYFLEVFQYEWLKTLTKKRNEIADARQIASGFERPLYGCYITETICSYLGKEDNCYELTMFRNFRDEYVSLSPEGQTLICEYYKKSPLIVDRILIMKDQDEIYPFLWENYLRRCLELLEENKQKECRDLYIAMVNFLLEKYLIK